MRYRFMPEASFDNRLIHELRKLGVDTDLITKYKPTIEQLRALVDGLRKVKQEFELRS